MKFHIPMFCTQNILQTVLDHIQATQMTDHSVLLDVGSWNELPSQWSQKAENTNILKADATAGKRKHICSSFVRPQLLITLQKNAVSVIL
jgi:hypothetical protein